MRYNIESLDDITGVIRQIQGQISGWALPKTRAVEVLTVCSELMHNLAAHAGDGWIDVTRRADTVHIVVFDNGPGLPPVSSAFSEGWSSQDSLGIGLPGVTRLCRELFIQTSERGTEIQAFMRAS